MVIVANYIMVTDLFRISIQTEKKQLKFQFKIKIINYIVIIMINIPTFWSIVKEIVKQLFLID